MYALYSIVCVFCFFVLGYSVCKYGSIGQVGLIIGFESNSSIFFHSLANVEV